MTFETRLIEQRKAEAEAQVRLNKLTVQVGLELTNLGHPATVDVAKSEGNPDAHFLRFDGFNVRASYVTYGANKGRIEWGGFIHIRAHDSYITRPRLNDTSSAADADPKRIAKAIVSRIIAPSVEDRTNYTTRMNEADAYRAKLPQAIAMVERIGFTVQQPKPGATEAGFFMDRAGVSGSARITPEGKVYIDRLSLDAETARCVLEFLAARKAKA